MDRIFWATCQCGQSFSVDYGIRFAGVRLECPYCRNKFLPEEAVALDERSG